MSKYVEREIEYKDQIAKLKYALSNYSFQICINGIEQSQQDRYNTALQALNTSKYENQSNAGHDQMLKKLDELKFDLDKLSSKPTLRYILFLI